VVPGLRCKENPPRERRLEPGEEARLLRGAEVYEQHPRCETRIKAAIQFAIATAMRQGEIGRVEWSHIQFQKAVVVVKRTKNGDTRSVPLRPSTVRMLQSLPRDREDGFVFGPAEALAHVFALVRERVGIEDLRFHDLRHEGTSRLFEETDFSPMEIASITGHKTFSMLQRYTHLRADRLAVKLALVERKIQLGPGAAMQGQQGTEDPPQTFTG
jgi:integrase